MNYYVLLWNILTFFFIPQGSVFSVMIRKPPKNITSLVGTEAAFTCEVTEQDSSEYVFWKKVSHEGFTDVLSYNNISMNTTKYSVRDTYTLVIRNVQVADEADYECQAGVERARTALGVAVLMDNMTLSFDALAPLNQNSLFNLTCHVTHSRPPAEIRWFHGNNELTVLASTCQKTFKNDGFGDSSSILSVPISKEALTEPYSCIASLPGVSESRTKSLYLPSTGSLASSASELSLSILIVILVFTAVLVLK